MALDLLRTRRASGPVEQEVVGDVVEGFGMDPNSPRSALNLSAEISRAVDPAAIFRAAKEFTRTRFRSQAPVSSMRGS
jgi:hypothetical protein